MILLIALLFASPTKVDSLFYTSINEDDSFQCKRFIREAKRNLIPNMIIRKYLKDAKKIYQCEDK